MSSEKEYILHTLRENFQHKKRKKICLYGTGKHTWELIHELKDYQIIGVVDFAYEGTEYNLLTTDEIKKQADFIVVVARPMLLKKIYMRIRKAIADISVYSIEGINIEQFLLERNINNCLHEASQFILSAEDKFLYDRSVEKLKVLPRQEDGNLLIPDLYTFINIFMAPFFVNLFLWVTQQAIKKKCDLLLFQARDGYLFQKMYSEERSQYNKDLPDAFYFYASRQAVISAVNNSIEQENYRQYLKGFSFDKYCNIGIYDFGARGTVQYYLEQIMKRKLHGLYYMKLPLETGSVEVDSYCGREMNFYQMKTFAQVFYPLLEAFFEAPHGSLKGFDRSGMPIQEEYIGNIDAKNHIYRATMDYYREYRSTWSEKTAPLISVQLLDALMEMLRSPQVKLTEAARKEFVLRDSFHNETLNFADDILI